MGTLKKISDQPAWVCSDCGRLWGHGWPEDHLATFHIGFCGVCGAEKAVTEPRDFRYLKEGWKRVRTVNLEERRAERRPRI